MHIKTTINIHHSILTKIDEAALLTGKSGNSIIIILLKRAMIDNRKLLRHNDTVKYQDRDPAKNWHPFHVRIRGDVHEFFLGMRYFYKFSLSWILAYSVRKYLYKIIRELTEEENSEYSDNYPYLGYIFIQEPMEGSVLWKLTWGIPKDLKKIL